MNISSGRKRGWFIFILKREQLYTVFLHSSSQSYTTVFCSEYSHGLLMDAVITDNLWKPSCLNLNRVYLNARIWPRIKTNSSFFSSLIICYTAISKIHGSNRSCSCWVSSSSTKTKKKMKKKQPTVISITHLWKLRTNS